MRFFIIVFLFCCSYAVNGQSFDSTIVAFELDRDMLSLQEGKQLALVAQRLKANTHRKILIYGYADYLGNDDYNKTLSTRRAKVVQRYLLQQGVAEAQILVTMGLGKRDERGAENEIGNALFRKVLILEKDVIVGTKTTQSERQVAIIVDTSLAQKLDKTSINQTFVLQDVNFQRHTAYLTDESIPKLQGLLRVMKANPALEIQLEGHICCNTMEGMVKGTFPYQLSILRARAIRNYLVSNNIASNRVRYTGYGRTRPLFEDETIEANINANMRVEVRVLSK